jgi:hypothetical protein
MDFQASQKLQSVLSSGETILWSGQPRQGLLLRASDTFLIPFSLLWGGFAIFWEYGAYMSGAPFFFLLFGVPFVLIGIYLIIGRFFIDSAMRKKTVYGVTNERVVILTELFSRKTKSLNLDTLSEITFTSKSDGAGSISFGRQQPMVSWMEGSTWPGMSQNQSPNFDLIENVKPVFDLIRDAQKRSR